MSPNFNLIREQILVSPPFETEVIMRQPKMDKRRWLALLLLPAGFAVLLMLSSRTPEPRKLARHLWRPITLNGWFESQQGFWTRVRGYLGF